MTRYLLGRAASLAFTLLVTSVVVFILVDIAPGDPAAYMMGLNADPQSLAALRTELGLDAPAPQRFFAWIGAMLRGDFGLSYTYRVPVRDLILERAQVSAPLAAMAFALSTAMAIGLSLYAVRARDQIGGRIAQIGAQLGLAIPNFWLALLLTLIFSVGLNWFNAGGFPGWDAGVWPALRALILPAFAIALPQAAILSQTLRAGLLEALSEDYAHTARAKGASVWRTLTHHALPNALIPALTILGLQFSFLLAGAVIIENVFYLPGLGRLVLQAVTQRDLIVVRGVIIALALLSVLVAFLVDILYALADPRLRREARG